MAGLGLKFVPSSHMRCTRRPGRYLLQCRAVLLPSGPTQLAQAVTAIQLKPKWQRLEINEEQPTSYRLRLNYKPTSLRATRIKWHFAHTDRYDRIGRVG